MSTQQIPRVVRTSVNPRIHPADDVKHKARKMAGTNQPFKPPSRFFEEEEEDDQKPAKKSLRCEEVLDEEELEATQPIAPDNSENSDSMDEDEDPEEEFRADVNEAIQQHGLELVRSWFNLEARKFKKPKIEKKK